jgi:hypothetical protein
MIALGARKDLGWLVVDGRFGIRKPIMASRRVCKVDDANVDLSTLSSTTGTPGDGSNEKVFTVRPSEWGGSVMALGVRTAFKRLPTSASR